MRRTRAEWVAWVAEIAAGGSAAEISRREGLRRETLLWWKWRLGHERRAAAKNSVRRAKPATRALAKFLPIESLALQSAPASVLTIDVAVLTVQVPVGAEPHYVAALVRALRAPC